MHVLEQLSLQTLNSGAFWGDGECSQADCTAVLESDNPTNGKVLARVQTASDEDYQAVMESAVQTAMAWRKVPAPQRGELVRAIGSELREAKDALGTLVTLETGKLKQEGDGEVQEMIDLADFATGQARMLYGRTMHSERPRHRMYEQWHPLGVVGVVTAFNFPVAVWAWNAFIAAIAGNAVVWKPSPQAPLCALAVQNICNRVMRDQGFPGVFSTFIPRGVELVQQFADDRRVALLSFTGSSTAGRSVNERVAARMGRSLLELSGNNAMIVTESADLALAVPAIVFGAVGTAGQRCTSTRRIFVQRSLFSDVRDALLNAYQQIRIGDPMLADTLMGPLISAQARKQFMASIGALKQKGGEILCGGEMIEGAGYFVQPTLALADNDWPVVQRETFGPLAYLIPYDTVDQAIAMQNDVPQGLSSALFTRDLQQAELFLSAEGSDCGIANINIGTSGAEVGGAFGGEKETGGGREAGSDAWRAYMRRQTNTINWSDELPLAQGIEFRLPTR